MIPKTIHYCWFGGGKKPRKVIKCIKSWKKHCKDYTIVEWNESNFDVNCTKYCEETFSQKRWAFLSDYARLQIIYEHGGIYLDTDVELIKPLDFLLENHAYLGYEIHDRTATGLGFGAEKGNPIIKEIMDEYNAISDFTNFRNNVDITTDVLRRHGIPRDNGNVQYCEDIALYPADYFCPKPVDTGLVETTERTVSIHHYTGSWFNTEQRKRNKKRRFKIKLNYYLHTPNRIAKKLLGKERYEKLKKKFK